MRFEWNEEKSKANIKKHKVSFERAVQVFLDPMHLEIPDPCENEDRWNAIGFAGSVLFVVYTERKDDVIRIISARKATKEEIDGYEDGYFGRS